MECITILAGSDNYAYVLVAGDEAVVIDACATEPILRTLEQQGAHLRMILSTHHHHDHTSGNRELARMTGCGITGGDARISGITKVISDGGLVDVAGMAFECMSAPGHTSGSFAFYVAEAGMLFTGDTLFYAGCGRVFEGTAGMLHQSLTRLAALPKATNVYAGHEYTLGNLAFAKAVEPNNSTVTTRMDVVKRSLAATGKYGPSTIGEECATNPFLRTGEAGIAAALGLPAGTAPGKVFELLRKRKDVF